MLSSVEHRSGATEAVTRGECWDEYLAWLKSTPPASHPDDLMTQYLDYLTASHVPPARMATAMDSIVASLAGDPHQWRYLFNNVYRSSRPGYSTRPNAFLKRVADCVPRGTALDIGMGQGRNSIYLAAKGWKVSGYDIAEAGLAAARLQALRTQVTIQMVQSSTQAFPYQADAWDLIVATYCTLPLKDREFVSKLKRSLRPGGLLLVETFSLHPPAGPHRMGFTVSPEDLLTAFGDLSILSFEETTDVADWSETQSLLVRFLAQRPDCTRSQV